MPVDAAPVAPDPPPPLPANLAQLVERLGGIPLARIRLIPPPGTATEQDVEGADGCELVDGVLVEKAMGYYESRLAVVLLAALEPYLENRDLGFSLEGDAL